LTYLGCQMKCGRLIVFAFLFWVLNAKQVAYYNPITW
jgi:hypothetical protein